LGHECEDRWLTIIYILDGNYKTLHVVAPTKEVFQLWDTTLRKLYAIRRTLMSGLGNFEMREAVWEKQYWKGTDESSDHRLNFEQIEKMCRRLNVHSSTESLSRLFKASFVLFFTHDVAETFAKGSRHPEQKLPRLQQFPSFCQAAQETSRN
jgi:phosphatidylinositol phospholipase C delta